MGTKRCQGESLAAADLIAVDPWRSDSQRSVRPHHRASIRFRRVRPDGRMQGGQWDCGPAVGLAWLDWGFFEN